MATEVARLFVSVGADTAALTAGMSSASQTIDRTAKRLTSLGWRMTSALTLPLTLVGKQMIDTTATFERQMNIIGTLADIPAGQMEQIGQVLLDVGADARTFGADANDAAEMLAEFVRTGISAEDALGGMENGAYSAANAIKGPMGAALNLAAASTIDWEQASMLIVNTMKRFGMGLDQVNEIANNYVAAANASASEVDTLAQAHVNAASTLSSYNITLDETNTMLAILSQHGLEGGRAGTRLANAWRSANRTSKAVTEALDELGVSLYTSTGEARNARDVIGDFRGALYEGKSALGELTEEQRNFYIQTIFGRRGMYAMIPLLEEGVAGYDAMADAIGEQSSAAEVARSRTEGLLGALAILKKTVVSVVTEAFLPLLDDALTPFVDKVTEIVRSIGEVNPQFLKWGVAVGAVVAAIGPLLIIAGGLLTLLGALVSPAGAALAAIVALGGGMGILAVSSQDVKDEFLDLFPTIGDVAGAASSAADIFRDLAGISAGLSGKLGGVGDALGYVGKMFSAVISQNLTQPLEDLSKITGILSGRRTIGGVWREEAQDLFGGTEKEIEGAVAATEGMENSMDSMFGAMHKGSGESDTYASKVREIEEAVSGVAGGLDDAGGAVDNFMADAEALEDYEFSLIDPDNLHAQLSYYRNQLRELVSERKAWSEEGLKVQENINDLERRINKKHQESLQAAWEKHNRKMQSALESAMQPTDVTELDFAKTRLGIYEDKVDEFVRRLKAEAQDSRGAWEQIIPQDVLAQGEDAIMVWAAKAEDMFYSLRWEELAEFTGGVFDPQAAEEKWLDAAEAEIRAMRHYEAKMNEMIPKLSERVGGLTKEEMAEVSPGVASVKIVGEMKGQELRTGLESVRYDKVLREQFATLQGEPTGNRVGGEIAMGLQKIKDVTLFGGEEAATGIIGGREEALEEARRMGGDVGTSIQAALRGTDYGKAVVEQLGMKIRENEEGIRETGREMGGMLLEGANESITEEQTDTLVNNIGPSLVRWLRSMGIPI